LQKKNIYHHLNDRTNIAETHGKTQFEFGSLITLDTGAEVLSLFARSQKTQQKRRSTSVRQPSRSKLKLTLAQKGRVFCWLTASVTSRWLAENARQVWASYFWLVII